MVDTATAHASLTLPVLETLAAAALVAVLVIAGLALLFAVVAGGGAWVLVLVLAVLRLMWTAARRAGRVVRPRLHRARGRVRQVAPETVPDLRVRPLG